MAVPWVNWVNLPNIPVSSAYDGASSERADFLTFRLWEHMDHIGPFVQLSFHPTFQRMAPFSCTEQAETAETIVGTSRRGMLALLAYMLLEACTKKDKVGA